MFVEFPGTVGPAVFTNADCIAEISVGPARKRRGTEDFYHSVGVTYKPGYERLIELFEVDEDYLPEWLNEVRDAITVSS